MIIDTSAPPSFSNRQRFILLVLLGAGFMLAIDYSILNVALPTVDAGVGLGSSGLPWIISAYTLPAAGFTLLFGRMADLEERSLAVAGVRLSKDNRRLAASSAD